MVSVKQETQSLVYRKLRRSEKVKICRFTIIQKLVLTE